MLVINNTPKVQVPVGVSLLHPLLIIQSYNQNYMKDIHTKYYIYEIHLGNIYSLQKQILLHIMVVCNKLVLIRHTALC
jgi:hypothetical protein